MAINQSQVDQIISSSSVDDPEVKMQNLQDEVDLLKKSIKKLLIDIRERMNEMENPFIIASCQPDNPISSLQNQLNDEEMISDSQIKDEPASQSSENEDRKLSEDNISQLSSPGQSPGISESVGRNSAEYTQLAADEALLLSMQQKFGEISQNNNDMPPEKLRLQKLHRLFEWTNKMVIKYGHDRLEIMIESYRTMGYISDDAYQQVNDIARLMPETLGEAHEISSDEFVSELYVLNRILSPNDSSLDRDMIEVLMDMRAAKQSTDEAPEKINEDLSKDEWIDMLDRI